MTKRSITASKWSPAAIVLALGNAIASAHPGHDLGAAPMTHLLTSPYHLAVLTLFGAGLLLSAAFVRRLTARRTMQVSGSIAIAVAAGTAAIQLLG